MMSKRFTTVLIIFNLIMAIHLFLASELILLQLQGYKVVSVSTSIDYDYPITPNGTPIPRAVLFPIINYPLIIFSIMLIVNILFYFKFRNQIDTSKTSS